MFLVYNSDLFAETNFWVSPHDRAFRYGDGLFETIRYEENRLWFWPDHYARLRAGMQVLHLSSPAHFSAEALHQATVQLLTANHLTNQPARVKIQVWRQTGGLYTPTNYHPNLLITAQPGRPFAVTERATVGIFEDVRLTHSPYSAFKTLSSLPYVMAGIAKQERGLDEVILLNADPEGYLAECQASNLFWFEEGVLYTPALETGCVNGIMRQHLLRTAAAIGQPVNVGFHARHRLAFAEAVFACNVSGIQWIRSIEAVGTYPAGHERADALFTTGL